MMKKMNAKEKKAALSIYAICFNMLIYLVLSVSISGAVAAFPEASPTRIQYLLTVPSLACIAGTFLVPLLGRTVSQRNLSITAQAVSLAGAAIYVLYPYSLPLLFVASIILGLAYGVLSTTFPLLVNIHMPEDLRAKVTGIASGMVQFGRLFSLFIAGFLGDIRWNYVYMTYFLVAISLCILIPALPPDTPALPQKSKEETGTASFLSNPGIWELIVADFVFGIIYFMTSTHISLYVEGYGLGTASTTGIITSVTCGVAGVIACLFAPVYRMLKRQTLPVIFLVLGVGFCVGSAVINLPAILFAVLCSTAAAAVFTPYILMRAAEVTTPDRTPLAVSLAIASLSIGFFISPSVTNFAAALFFDGSPAAAYRFGGISALICAVVTFLLKHRQSKTR